MRTVYIIVLFLVSSVSSAQSNLDSLYSVWNDLELPDSMRLEAIDDYIWEGFLYQHPDSAFNLSLVQYVMAKRSGNDEQTGNALSNLGQSKLFAGDLDQAEKYAIKNLNFTKNVNDTLGLPRAYNLVGMVYNDKLYFKESKTYFDSCITYAKKHNQKHLLTRVYHNVGVLYNKFSKFDQAIKSYNYSLALEKELGNIRGSAMTNKQIANVYFNMGNFSAAYELYDDVINICEENSDLMDLYAETCSDIGNLLNKQGNYEKSSQYYLKSIVLAKEHGYVITEAISNVNLGTNYNDVKEHDKALEHFIEALQIFKDMGHLYGEAVSLTNIGEVNTIKGNYDTALVYLTNGFDIFKELDSYFGMASSYNYQANLYLGQGLLDKCIESCEKSLAISREYKLHEQIGGSYETLYQAYLGKNDTENCLRILNATKAYRDQDLKVNYFSMSESQKDLYFQTMIQDYHNYFDFALKYGDEIPGAVDSCFNIALRSKGLSLKSTSALRKEVLNSNDDEVVRLYTGLISLKEQIADEYTRGADVDSLEKVALSLERRLIKKSKSFSSFSNLRNVSWRQVEKEMKRGETIIEFVHFKSLLDPEQRNRYAALLLNHGERPLFIPICFESELEEALRKEGESDLEFVQKLYQKDQDSNQLYNLIWKPLESHLNQTKKVIVSPSGLLHKVAFASLPVSGKDLYLCQEYEINLSNSSSALIDNSASFHLTTEDDFLLIGGVQYSSDSTNNEVWKYLPGTLKETYKISNYLKGADYSVTYLNNEEATEENFKKMVVENKYVHVATHGFFFPDPMNRVLEKTEVEVVEDVDFRGGSNYARWSFVENKNPLMRSGITFAFANDVWKRSAQDLSEDGIFTAKEAASLDLSATKLMVLSACETGLGDIRGSEGVYGLQRSLKLAGVDQLIMSLWQVPDKETSEFMELFYKNLIDNGSVRESFNNAQLMMSRKYEPYFWGAFVLIE